MVTGNKENLIVQGLAPDQYSSDHSLYALVANNSLLWAVANADKTVLSIGEIGFEKANRIATLKNWIANDLKNIAFQNTNVAFRSCDLVIVPNALYDFKQSSELLKLSCGVSHEHCLSFSISRLSATIVFGVDDELLGSFQNVYRGQKELPSQGYMVDALLKHNRFDRNPQIVIDIHGEKCDFIVVGHSKLFLVNTFEFKTDEDILFYTANVVKQLGLENQEISIEVCGEVTINQIELMKSYFETVDLFLGYDLPLVAEGIGVHARHTTLLNLISCA